eukprot:CAMPEP_0181411024 /NCGR_PEP_ID=MMETSP1110-20121109/7651_1 /TAXON_ID=174948 /ORGANISM="Symbiodinium sp., Strain CCMP421" /LENGTH=381 /DNA_ID=CAMNT_0023533609 /DNA_START=70 /DNA_END=1212 /DNA_ORIENTATION=+
MGIRHSFSKSIFDCFDLGDLIGSGNFGQVLLCTRRDEPSQGIYAVKVVDMESSQAKAMEVYKAARDELHIMKGLDHPNIVKLIQVFQDKRFLYVVMERVKGGELFEALKSEHALIIEQDVARVGLQLMQALDYIHGCSIVHRDIKAQNILLTEPPILPGRALQHADIKLIDFGLSAKLPRECWRSHERAFDTICGTPACCAPEIWATQEKAMPLWRKRWGFRYGLKVDIYAAGVVLYMALLGKLPFSASDTRKLANLVCSPNEFPSFESKQPGFQVSKSCRECLSMMMEKDPGRRCSAYQAMRHCWLQGTAPIKRALPKPIPQEVRLSAAMQAQVCQAQQLPEAEVTRTPQMERERSWALAQARSDWEDQADSDESDTDDW